MKQTPSSAHAIVWHCMEESIRKRKNTKQKRVSWHVSKLAIRQLLFYFSVYTTLIIWYTFGYLRSWSQKKVNILEKAMSPWPYEYSQLRKTTLYYIDSRRIIVSLACIICVITPCILITRNISITKRCDRVLSAEKDMTVSHWPSQVK